MNSKSIEQLVKHRIDLVDKALQIKRGNEMTASNIYLEISKIDDLLKPDFSEIIQLLSNIKDELKSINRSLKAGLPAKVYRV